ncbi:hypothetical protein EOD42_13440 [Rhodovarius crocodyli]|uniref:J domain-containing protein n=1 Tax=Rhodovarius crocodyli TaxID=1979269 RepID=A0A437MES7_9PROT|nr:hypothetical protein [Rhodovarius crocodyli]RVT96119.1 hypothetical protein EOD42_13440 [Rhodovarius crocodyli]
MDAGLQLGLVLFAFLLGVAMVANARMPETLEREDDAGVLRARVKALEVEVSELEGLCRAASRARDAARERAMRLDGEAIRDLRRAFARRYHPDRVAGSVVERRVKAEIFSEFWAEIERVERAYTSTTT